MIASLPLYDWPEIQEANDALWAAWRDRLRSAGVAAPDGLARDPSNSEATYDRSDLVATQVCGWPVATRYADRLTPFAAPMYDVAGAARDTGGAHYRSVVVTRCGDDRRLASALSGTIALNGLGSFSGWAALGDGASPCDGGGRAVAQPTALHVAGAHRDSARAVADGRADAAAIDCYCWALIEAHEPDLAARLDVRGWTDPAPAPPYAAPSGASVDVATLRRTLDDALRSPEASAARSALMLSGVAAVDPSDYAPLARRTPPKRPTAVETVA